MDVTEVMVRLCEPEPDSLLRAYASIGIGGDFVVHDLRVIEARGQLFVAMPSRKLMERCPHCRVKNHLLARFCNGCGERLPEILVKRDEDGRMCLYTDIAHPITTDCRAMIDGLVLDAYAREQESQRTQSVRSANDRPHVSQLAYVRSGSLDSFGAGIL